MLVPIPRMARLTPPSATVAMAKRRVSLGVPTPLLETVVPVDKLTGSKINVVAELLPGQTPLSPAGQEVAPVALLCLAVPVALTDLQQGPMLLLVVQDSPTASLALPPITQVVAVVAHGVAAQVQPVDQAVAAQVSIQEQASLAQQTPAVAVAVVPLAVQQVEPAAPASQSFAMQMSQRFQRNPLLQQSHQASPTHSARRLQPQAQSQATSPTSGAKMAPTSLAQHLQRTQFPILCLPMLARTPSW